MNYYLKINNYEIIKQQMQRKKNGLYDAMWGFCLKISEKYWIRHAEGHYSLTAALTLTNKIETPVQIKIAHSNIKAVFFFFCEKLFTTQTEFVSQGLKEITGVNCHASFCLHLLLSIWHVLINRQVRYV